MAERRFVHPGLRPPRRNHVWTYDFGHEQTHDGRALRMMTVLDEYSRECLARAATQTPPPVATSKSPTWPELNLI